MKIIGISGLAGSGKSVAADYLIDKEDGERVKFAGALKDMLRAFYRYLEVSDEEIERRLEGDLKEAPCDHLGGKTPRYAMQTLGAEWGRDLIDNELWVRTAMAKAARANDRGKVAIFDDLRFANECRAITDNGGISLRLVAPKNRRDAGTSHSSEAGIGILPVDSEVVNDATIYDLQKRVGIAVGSAKFRAKVRDW